MRKLALIAALAFVGAGASQAVLLYSFESGLDGWTDNSGDAAITLSQDTIGAVHGTKSMKVAWGGNFGWINTGQTQSGVEEAIRDNWILRFSITVVGSDMNVGWANSILSFNDAQGWRQTSTGINLPRTAGTHVFEIDYTSLTRPDPSGTWFQIHWGINAPSGSNLAFYVDSIEAVPEPGTIAALAIGAAALLGRRRR